jgi:Protein of unknown function (DUF1194)
VRDGINGRIAVTYFEWAGPLDQKIIVPWRKALRNSREVSPAM